MKRKLIDTNTTVTEMSVSDKETQVVTLIHHQAILSKYQLGKKILSHVFKWEKKPGRSTLSFGINQVSTTDKYTFRKENVF